MATDPGKTLQAVFAACAVAAAPVIAYEGWRKRTYVDPVSLPTVCAGITGPAAIKGKTYTDAECEVFTAQALVKHGLAIAPCLPPDLPTDTRAAFISAAYNIGPSAFCSSSMSRLALAGDRRGSCAALSLWIKAGGHVLPGLVRRRQAERALCERGL